MKRSKYVILLGVSMVSYMLVNQLVVDLSSQPPYYTSETTTQSSLPPSHQTIGLEDLDGILFDGQVVLILQSGALQCSEIQMEDHGVADASSLMS